jgi:hypothetical protein
MNNEGFSYCTNKYPYFYFSKRFVLYWFIGLRFSFMLTFDPSCLALKSRQGKVDVMMHCIFKKPHISNNET